MLITEQDFQICERLIAEKLKSGISYASLRWRISIDFRASFYASCKVVSEEEASKLKTHPDYRATFCGIPVVVDRELRGAVAILEVVTASPLDSVQLGEGGMVIRMC